MATKQDDLVDKLSELSIKTKHHTGTDDVVDAAWLVTYPIKGGYSFRCSLSLKQLIDRQLSQKYFEELLSVTEQKKNIYDFHMRLRPYGQHGLTVDIIHKDADDKSGPVKSEVCMSCDMNSELSQLSLIKQNLTTCVWLDAQLRNKLIITPQKHIERLSEMIEDEMAQFWYDTQAVLDEERCNWQSMILNHGKYRNHFHLHMKINIEKHQWNQRIKYKYEDKIQQMQYLLNSDEPNAVQKYFGDRKFNEWSGIKNFNTKGKK